MESNPFSATTCTETVGVFRALLGGVPDGACVEINLSPFTLICGLIVLGVAIVAVQILVRRMIFGPARPRRAPHEPELSLREAANLARAERIAREAGH